MSRRRTLLVLSVAFALGAAAAAAHAAKPLPGAVGNCLAKSVQVRPGSIVLACADDNFYLGGLTWSGWTASSATGAGVAHVNDCIPYCAAGHFHTYRVTVRLSRPATCRGARRPRFTRLVYRFVEAKPASQARRGAYSYSCG